MSARVSAAERAALPVARAALESQASGYGVSDAIVFALGSAGLLMSPETAAELTALRERPEPLPDDQFAAVRARVEAATPGPWCTDDWEIYQGAEYQPGLSEWIGETCRGKTTVEQDRADAAFIAAARTDVPVLLDHVTALEQQVAAVRAFAVSHEYRWLLELLDGPGTHGGAL